MTLRHYIFFVLGVINVGLGTAGIFLPLLPTTPFLLLAAYLFARSNEKWHRWLLNHRHLGPYIHAFRGKSGLTKGQKFRIIASITVVMWISAYFVPYAGLKAMLLVMWVFWSCLILRMRTASSDAPPCTFADEPSKPKYFETCEGESKPHSSPSDRRSRI